MIDFDKYFPHVGVVSAFTTNQFGDTTATSPYTTPCFYYYGPRMRTRNGYVAEENLNHYILLPSTAAVGQDYVLSSIVDSAGTTLAPVAKVSRVERFTHWRNGVQLLQCLLQLN